MWRFEIFQLFMQVQIFHTPNGKSIPGIYMMPIHWWTFFPPHSMYYKVWIWIMCENNLIRWKSTAFSIQVKYNGGNLYKKLLVKKRYSSEIGKLSREWNSTFSFFYRYFRSGMVKVHMQVANVFLEKLGRCNS